MEHSEIETFERNRIAELLNRLLEQEKFTNMKGERSKLWKNEDRLQDYTVLDRLDILSADIIGYVSGITSNPYSMKEPEKVINHLHKLSLFNLECILKWYPSATEEYPKIKQYFELLDYIRLLTIDYIQRFWLQKSYTK